MWPGCTPSSGMHLDTQPLSPKTPIFQKVHFTIHHLLFNGGSKKIEFCDPKKIKLHFFSPKFPLFEIYTLSVLRPELDFSKFFFEKNGMIFTL